MTRRRLSSMNARIASGAAFRRCFTRGRDLSASRLGCTGSTPNAAATSSNFPEVCR